MKSWKPLLEMKVGWIVRDKEVVKKNAPTRGLDEMQKKMEADCANDSVSEQRCRHR